MSLSSSNYVTIHKMSGIINRDKQTGTEKGGWLKQRYIPILILILVVALIVIGPQRLPEIAMKLGKMMRNFKKITTNLTIEMKKAMDEEEVQEIKKTAQEVKETLKVESEELTKTVDAETKEVKETLTKEAEALAEVTKLTDTGDTKSAEPTDSGDVSLDKK